MAPASCNCRSSCLSSIPLTELCQIIWPSQQALGCHCHTVHASAEGTHQAHVKTPTARADCHPVWQVSKVTRLGNWPRSTPLSVRGGRRVKRILPHWFRFQPPFPPPTPRTLNAQDLSSCTVREFYFCVKWGVLWLFPTSVLKHQPLPSPRVCEFLSKSILAGFDCVISLIFSTMNHSNCRSNTTDISLMDPASKRLHLLYESQLGSQSNPKLFFSNPLFRQLNL